MTDQENPYVAPRYTPSTGDEHAGVALDANGRFVPASRGARLVAAIIDGLFALTILVALGVLAGLLWHGELMKPGTLFNRDPDLQGFVQTATPLVALAVQAVLIARRGQSVGKIAMRLRIVRADGRTANLYHGFVLRTLPIAGFGLLVGLIGTSAQPLRPMISLVTLIDVLLIFGSASQCGHDRIAGTFVAKARSGDARPTQQ